jgi:hypothetical protein
MTPPHCRRCEFVETDDEPLAVHAIGSAHPLCIVCGHSLTDTEPAVCERCLDRTQHLLADILALWAELPGHLGHLHGWNPGAGRSSDGAPLTGGTVLVMLGPGNHGGAPRTLPESEQRRSERWWLKHGVGPLTQVGYMQAERERYGREHQIDNLDTDSTSVAQQLGSWASEWMDERGELEMLGRTPTRIVLKAAGYLERRMRWAANRHPAFDAFVHDLRVLHGELERATARSLPRENTGASCLDCRKALVTFYDRDTGLAQDHVTCVGCGREYTPYSYRLASAAAVEANLGWVSIREASRRAQVSFRTVQTWATREQVQVDWQDGRRCVWWPDIRDKIREAS